MTTPLNEFVNWERDIRDEVNVIKELLSENLSDEPEKLIKDLEMIEVWNARSGFLLAEANSFLDKARPFYMPTKEGNSEADRKSIADREMADIRKFRDFMEVIQESIKSRLMLGMSVLGYMRQFKEPSVIQNNPTDYRRGKAA